MKRTSEVTPRLDLIARILCIGLGSALAAGAWIAYDADGFRFACWLFGFGAATLLAVGTVGPQRVRIGLVTWLPWV